MKGLGMNPKTCSTWHLHYRLWFTTVHPWKHATIHRSPCENWKVVPVWMVSMFDRSRRISLEICRKTYMKLMGLESPEIPKEQELSMGQRFFRDNETGIITTVALLICVANSIYKVIYQCPSVAVCSMTLFRICCTQSDTCFSALQPRE